MSHKMHLPKFGITVRIYLGVMTALLIAFVLSAVFILPEALNEIESYSQEEIEEDGTSFQRYFEREIADLTAVGNWLVRQKGLTDLIDRRDSNTIGGYFAPWVKSSVIDSITVVDTNGRVLARINKDLKSTQGDNVYERAGVKDGLAGIQSNGLGQDTFGRTEGSVLIPIYENEQLPPIGLVIFSFYLDGSFLQDIVRSPDTDIVIAFKDRITSNSFTNPGGNLSVGQIVPPAIIAAERENRSTEYLDLEVNDKTYRFRFYPVVSPAHSTAGMVGVGLPLASIIEKRLALLQTWGIGLGAGLSVVTILGLILARGLVIPIHQLSSAAYAISKGDFSSPIELKRNDELGDLAHQMDTMRRQLDVAMQSSNREKHQYAAIIHSMAVPVVMTDEHHLIIVLNDSAERLLHQSTATLIGHPWHELLVMNEKDDSTLAPVWRAEMMQSEQGTGLFVHGRFPLRRQPQIILDITSTPVQYNGKSTGYVHCLQDVTKLEEFVRSKDDYLLNVAHELEGPLASWRVAIDLLIDDYINLNTRELGVMLRNLQRTTYKFQDLIQNLIDIGRIQAGRFTVHPTPISLDRILRDAIDQIEPLLRTKGQRIEIQKDHSANCAVLADRVRIIQVIVNLLKNASKYGPEDQPIVLSTCRDEGFVFLGITDYGSGISPEDQRELFQRFFRGKRAQEEGAGIGLGLALAKGIVEAHGGHISVHSQFGEGATFWFSLPEPVEERS